MAQQSTDRELRQVRRDDVRDRQELQRRNVEMMEQIERLSGQIRDMQAEGVQRIDPQRNGTGIRSGVRQNDNLPTDNHSVISDVGTIDQYLRDDVRNNIRDLEEEQELKEMEENMKRHEKDHRMQTSVAHGSFRETEVKSARHQNVGCILQAPHGQDSNHGVPRVGALSRQGSCHVDQTAKAPSIQESDYGDQQQRNSGVGASKDVGNDSTWDPNFGCVRRNTLSSGTCLKTTLTRPPDTGLISAKPPDEAMAERMESVKRDQEEIRSQHSYYENRSVKLRQNKMDEEERRRLMLEDENRLRLEIEKKRKAEQELMKRIQQIEIEERELDRSRAENDRIERELLECIKQDEEMSKRLQLLREKEKLLIVKSEMMRDSRSVNVKSEFLHDVSGKAAEIALHTSTPYQARDSQYGCRVPDYRKNKDGRSDGVPDYDRIREKERGPEQKVRYSIRENEADAKGRVEEEIEALRAKTRIREAVVDSQGKGVSKAEEPPDNSFPLFKMGLPKVPNFNGKQFEQWKTEVNCLLMANIYPDYSIAQAVRNSLKDDTRQILLTLKPTSTTIDILRKVEEVYGNVKTGDNIVSEFYAAKQKEKENVSAWGIRLETLFQQAVEKGEIEEKKRDKKLKERFWRGIHSEKLKNATRVSYESDDSFETLRKKARREEEEVDKEKKSDETRPNQASVNQQMNTSEKDKTLKEILERMKGIETELENMRKRNEDKPDGNRWQSRGSFRGRYRGYNRRPNYGRQQDQTSHGRQQDKQQSDHQQSNTSEKKPGQSPLN